MRTREMKLSDHGVPPEDEPRLRKMCRTATGYNLDLLRHAIASAAPGIEQPIKDSLTTGIGYVELSKKEYYRQPRRTFTLTRGRRWRSFITCCGCWGGG